MDTRRTLGLASLLVTLASLATGCSLGGQTEGDHGKLAFKLTNDDCLLGCALDEPILASTEVSLHVDGVDVEKAAQYKASTGDAAIARVTKSVVSCSCNDESGDKSRSIDPPQRCAAGEEKECRMSVTVASSGPGDTKIEIHDGSGLVDSTTMHFRASDAIDVTVYERPVGGDRKEISAASDGAYEVRVGSDIEIASTARAGGDELVTGKGSFRIAYAQPDVLAQGGAGYPQANRENVAAKRAGESRVTITPASGAPRELRFRVLP